MRLARVLVHESCHMHQYAKDLGLEDNRDARVLAEKECVGNELKMVLEIDSGNCHVDRLRHTLAYPDWYWVN